MLTVGSGACLPASREGNPGTSRLQGALLHPSCCTLGARVATPAVSDLSPPAHRALPKPHDIEGSWSGQQGEPRNQTTERALCATVLLSPSAASASCNQAAQLMFDLPGGVQPGRSNPGRQCRPCQGTRPQATGSSPRIAPRSPNSLLPKAARGDGALPSTPGYRAEIQAFEEKAGGEVGCTSLTRGDGGSHACCHLDQDLYPRQPPARHL